MRLLLTSFIIISFILNCSSFKTYVVNAPLKEIEQAIDSSIVKIGLNISKSDSIRIIDGPMNRDSELSLESLGNSQTRVKFINPVFMDFYSDNLIKVINAELKDQFTTDYHEKSKVKQALFTLVSPGLGWYYMVDQSIYWDKGSKFASLTWGLFDLLLMYQVIAKNNQQALIPMIVVRTGFIYYGNYFISYDNKLIKAGYNINF